MPVGVRFLGGPLDGEVFFVPRPPSELYVHRSIGADGISHIPARHEAPALLRAGVYRRSADPSRDGRLTYRFQE